MLLEPSRYIKYTDRRQLLGFELSLGGHGQIPITGTNSYAPTSGYNFYEYLFTSASVVSSISFADYYQTNNASFAGLSFPAGSVWYAPSSAIKLTSGSAIAYQYERLSNVLVDNCTSNYNCGQDVF